VEIQSRPAQAGDVKQAVPLIYSSGPEIFDFIFGHKVKGSALKYLISAFLSEKGELGYQNFTLAVVDDNVVGSGACFNGSEKSKFMLPGALHIISYYGLVDCWRVMWNAVRVEQVIEPPKVDLHYIAYLGVAPEWRGQGIGTRMVHNLLEQGRRAKRTLAALDVAVHNPRAQALYERLGFKVVGERKSDLSNEFGVVGPHRRMEIYL
jgi:ribosomal protein S18 acetylase RimI-like enzyme